MDAQNVTGKLNLEFKRYGDQTRLTSQFYKLPLQVLPPHNQDQDGTAFVYILNPSGGVLQGDRMQIELKLGRAASVFATTPSSSKFYRMEEDNAVVNNTFYLESGAVLEYMPGHSVPFAGTNAVQNNRFYMKDDAVLFAVDAITPGRTARGERFAYQRFCSKTSIYVDERLVLYDCMDIKPEEERLNEIGMLEGWDMIAGIYLYKRGTADELRKKILKHSKIINGVKLGATAVTEDLLVVRILGANMMQVQDVIADIWGITRTAILNKSAVRIRKY